MIAGNLVKMVVGNTMRSRRHFVLSAFGIVIGIATFVLFLASTEQVQAVLAKIFPVEEVEVIPPKVALVAMDTKHLDDSTAQAIKARPEVVRVLPRMSILFPAFGEGSFNGAAISLEIGGAADGIEPSYVIDDPALDAESKKTFGELFRDWEDDHGKPRVACTPVPSGERSTCPQSDRYYCDKKDRTCHHRVPVVISPTMLELYNTEYARSHGTPMVGEDFAKFMVKQGGLDAMRFQLLLGASVFGTGSPSKAREVEAVVIGISGKAKRIGMTVPLGYIARWNTEFVGEEAGKTYSSIVVTLASQQRIAVFGQWIQDKLDLRLEDSVGQQLATAVFIIRLVLIAISLVIIVISAINIGHNFFMQVTERRRELGLLRALGATQRDVMGVVLGEAALIGVIGGLLGVLAALGLGALIDFLVSHYLPRFPYKPTTWFHFKWWIWVGGLACAAAFAVIGGYLPARKASRMEPATALAQG